MRGSTRAFTLLELLVAISLMALIAGSLYSSLYIATKAHRSATTAVEPARTAALTLEFLRQDFDAALPPTGILAGAFEGTAGVGAGGSDALEFYSCANVPGERDTASDIRKVELSVELVKGDDHPVLMRRLTANLLASNAPVLREQVLCRRVKSLKFTYFDGSVWQETWDSTGQGNVLPVAVQATLEFLVETQPADGAERTYRVSHVFGLPCALPVQDADLVQN